MTKLCIADAELHHFSYEVLKALPRGHALALGPMVLALALASKVQAKLSPWELHWQDNKLTVVMMINY